MTPSREPTDRERDLEDIRHTYDRYRREGRERLWDLSNRGFARMMRDRDSALVDLMARSLPQAGARVLDLGSGDGRLAAIVRGAGLEVEAWTGIDLDPSSVATAATAYPWAEFREASADAIPFAGAAFDGVVATTLFSSLPSVEFQQRVAAEIKRVLRPGGWVIWYDIRYDNPRNPHVHGVNSGALARLFPGWRTELRPITVLPPIARRLGRLTTFLYPVLEAIPLLRSHLIGRFGRPTSS